MRRLIITAFLAFLSLAALAQSTLKDGMKAVSERYGVNFIYDSSLPVNVRFKGQDLKGKTLQASLKTLFDGTGIAWEVKKKYVLLSKDKSPLTIYATIQELDEKADTIKAATITGKMDRDMNFTQTGLTKLDGAVFRRGFAVLSAPDVLKTLQALPGVASGTEMLSNLYVHGGDGSDNLFLLDGVPLYQICHLGGIFSAFNTDVIEDLDFYKSGFPARYGGRTSSVVDITTKDGSFSDYSGSFSVGLLEGRVRFDGPILKDKTSFNIALRRSWADVVMYPACWIMNARDESEGLKRMAGYSFTDANAKITHRFRDGSLLTANVYGGHDGLKFRQTDGNDLGNNLDGYDDDFTRMKMSWGNVLTSVNWRKEFSDNLSLKLCGYWSGSRSKVVYDEGYEYDYTILKSGEHFREDYCVSLTNRSVLNDTGVTADLDWKAGRNHHLRFGGSYIWHNYRPEYIYDETDIYNGHNDIDEHQRDTVRANGHEISVYAEDEMRLTDWLKANVGLRNTVYVTSSRAFNSLEPRMALKFQCGPSVSIKASYSEMSQFSHQVSSTYLDLPTNSWLPSGSTVSPMRSRQVAGGVYSRLPHDLHLNVEGWYKTLDNLIEYSGMNTFFPKLTDWENNFKVGRGRSYGMEVDFGYETKNLSVNAFYTLSWTQRFFEDIWPEWYRDRNDNRHKLTIQANWRLNEKWEFYGAWNYHSGNRMSVATQYVKNVYETGDEHSLDNWGDMLFPSHQMWLYEEPNNVKLPDYHRLDLGMNVHIKTKRGNESVWNLSIYNVYCRINPIYAYVELVKGSGADFGKTIFKGVGVGVIPIVPTFSYTLKF